MSRESRFDPRIAQQEGAFIQTLPPKPAGDFVIAFAGIAGTAGRYDVVQGISSAAGQRQHAVALQWLADYPAVCAPTPRLPESGPLLVAKVVCNAIHPTLTPSGSAGAAASDRSHLSIVIGEDCAILRVRLLLQ